VNLFLGIQMQEVSKSIQAYSTSPGMGMGWIHMPRMWSRVWVCISYK